MVRVLYNLKSPFHRCSLHILTKFQSQWLDSTYYFLRTLNIYVTLCWYSDIRKDESPPQGGVKSPALLLHDGNHEHLLKRLSSSNHFLDALWDSLIPDADQDEMPDVVLLSLSTPTQKAPDSNPLDG